MSSLYLPPGVTREMLAERQEREAQAGASGVFVSDDRCREFNPLLLNVDPYLRMVFCREPAPLEAVACGARPGRYNLVRETPGSPVTFIPVIAEDGGYAEPNSTIFELLKSMDWQDPRVQRDRKDQEERLERARAKREQDERRERDEDVYERFKAVSRAQVSMSDAIPWTQNSSPHARRDAAKRKRR